MIACRLFLLLFFFITAVSCGNNEKSEIQRPEGLVEYPLNLDEEGSPRVSDGDTFEIIDPDASSDEDRINKIRILGIDTPEKGRIKGMEPFGLAATRFLEKKLLGLKEIEVLHWNDSGAKKDAFGRILAEPYVRNEYPSRELLRQGLAISCFFSNSMELSPILIPIQNEAIGKMLGIWSLMEGSHPDSMPLLKRIVKNCNGIPGGVNINMLRESQLRELPGFSSETAKSLSGILGEIKSWNELESLLKSEALFSSDIIASIKSLYDTGLFVIRDKNFGYGPMTETGETK